MSTRQPMQVIVKGAAFATAAAVLAPLNVMFLMRGTWPAVILIGLAQLVLLVVGIYFMATAYRRVKK